MNEACDSSLADSLGQPPADEVGQPSNEAAVQQHDQTRHAPVLLGQPAAHRPEDEEGDGDQHTRDGEGDDATGHAEPREQRHHAEYNEREEHGQRALELVHAALLLVLSVRRGRHTVLSGGHRVDHGRLVARHRSHHCHSVRVAHVLPVAHRQARQHPARVRDDLLVGVLPVRLRCVLLRLAPQELTEAHRKPVGEQVGETQNQDGLHRVDRLFRALRRRDNGKGGDDTVQSAEDDRLDEGTEERLAGRHGHLLCVIILDSGEKAPRPFLRPFARPRPIPRGRKRPVLSPSQLPHRLGADGLPLGFVHLGHGRGCRGRRVIRPGTVRGVLHVGLRALGADMAGRRHVRDGLVALRGGNDDRRHCLRGFEE
eukprot:Hpha_TRINITY_DN15487_c3_g6::TRINITY_DN15487_c3_g6_i2::g.177379::m.177379